MISLSAFDNLIRFLSDFIYRLIAKKKNMIIEKNAPVTLIEDKNNVFINKKNIVNFIFKPSLE